MANREALRELQGRLAERMRTVGTAGQVASWLAVEAGGHGFLLPLAEAGEIFSGMSWLPVAHTAPWFKGVANLRGGLHGVVDLAEFFGLRRGAAVSDQARLIALNPSLEVNCALLVDRLAGLRNADQLSVDAASAGTSRPLFVGERLRDAAGRSWQALRLAHLAREEQFLKIVG
jgi:twitching motility protein PilI